MGRHYSMRDFFRQMPNALLGRCFEARGVLAGLDFPGMKETRPEALFAESSGIGAGAARD
jgi:hypothetical protein